MGGRQKKPEMLIWRRIKRETKIRWETRGVRICFDKEIGAWKREGDKEELQHKQAGTVRASRRTGTVQAKRETDKI